MATATDHATESEATIQEQSPASGTISGVTRWRIKVDDYYRVAEAGLFARDARLELIEGEIFILSPIGNRHAACVDRTTEGFHVGLQGRAILRVQGPLRIDDHNEPQPDLMLLRRREDFYASAHPGPADVLLLVEIMDTSAAYDRGVKLALYARAEIAEVWLIDLNNLRIEIHRQPSQALYTEISIRTRGQRVSPGAFNDLELEVNALLA